ncbi:MAG: hypothetical protein HY828_06025 [Actinobacteria bacterium]|nr:hypothetical protein [Actinomycetota bacterium]
MASDSEACVQDLLQEGLRGYLDAMLAIKEFHRQAIAVCHAVLAAALPRLNKAMGTDLSEKAIERYVYPRDVTSENWVGTWAWVGVCIKNAGPGIFYCALHLAAKGDLHTAEARATLALFRKALRSDTQRAFGPNPPECEEGAESELRYFRSLHLDRPDLLRTYLENAVEEWIKAWTRVGGIKGLKCKLAGPADSA